MTQNVNLRRLGVWCGGLLLLALLLWLSALPSLPGVWAQEDPRPTPTNVGNETPTSTATATTPPTTPPTPVTPTYTPTTLPTDTPTTPAPTTEPGPLPTDAPGPPPPPQQQPQTQPAPGTQAPSGVTTVPQTGLLDSAGAPVALLALILTIGIFGARRLRKHPNSSDLR